MLPDELSLLISQNCERNLRRAILMLEASKVKQLVFYFLLLCIVIFNTQNCNCVYFNFRYPFDINKSVVIPDWQLFISDTAKQILSQQTPGKLFEVRSMLYELIVHGIPTNVIFKVK